MVLFCFLIISLFSFFYRCLFPSHHLPTFTQKLGRGTGRGSAFLCFFFQARLLRFLDFFVASRFLGVCLTVDQVISTFARRSIFQVFSSSSSFGLQQFINPFFSTCFLSFTYFRLRLRIDSKINSQASQAFV